MKKIFSIILSVCIAFIFVSCSSSNNNEYTNPYQSYEETTKIKDDFNSKKKILKKLQ